MEAVDANVRMLPVWRKNASAAELFEELATVARIKPQLFTYVVIVCEEACEPGEFAVQTYVHEADAIKTVGLLETGKFKFLKDCYGSLW